MSPKTIVIILFAVLLFSEKSVLQSEETPYWKSGWGISGAIIY